MSQLAEGNIKLCKNKFPRLSSFAVNITMHDSQKTEHSGYKNSLISNQKRGKGRPLGSKNKINISKETTWTNHSFLGCDGMDKKIIDNTRKGSEESRICNSNKQKRARGRPSLSKRFLNDSEAITPKCRSGIKPSDSSGTCQLKGCSNEVAKISTAMVCAVDEAVSPNRTSSRLSEHDKCIIENYTTKSAHDEESVLLDEKGEIGSAGKVTAQRKEKRGRPKSVVKFTGTFSNITNKKNINPDKCCKNSVYSGEIGQKVNNCVRKRPRGRPKLSKSLIDCPGAVSRKCDKKISSGKIDTSKNVTIKCGEDDVEMQQTICQQSLSDKCENEKHPNKSLYMLGDETNQKRILHDNNGNKEEFYISIPEKRKCKRGRPKLSKSFIYLSDNKNRNSEISSDKEDKKAKVIKGREFSTAFKCVDEKFEMEHKVCQKDLSERCANKTCYDIQKNLREDDSEKNFVNVDKTWTNRSLAAIDGLTQKIIDSKKKSKCPKVNGTEEIHICKSNKQKRARGRPSLSTRFLNDSEAITTKCRSGIKHSDSRGTFKLNVCLDEVAKISTAMVSAVNEAASSKRSNIRLSGHDGCIMEYSTTKSKHGKESDCLYEKEEKCCVEKITAQRKRQRGRPKSVVKFTSTFSDISNKKRINHDNSAKKPVYFAAIGQDVDNNVQKRSKGRPKLSKSIIDLPATISRGCDNKEKNSKTSSDKVDTCVNVINVEELSSFVEYRDDDTEIQHKICQQAFSDKCENEEDPNKSLYLLESETKQKQVVHKPYGNQEQNCITTPANKNGQNERRKLSKGFIYLPETISKAYDNVKINNEISSDKEDTCKKVINVEDIYTAFKCRNDELEMEHKACHEHLSDKCEHEKRTYKSLFQVKDETLYDINEITRQEDSEIHVVNEEDTETNAYNLPRARPPISTHLDVTNNGKVRNMHTQLKDTLGEDSNVSNTDDFYNEKISKNQEISLVGKLKERKDFISSSRKSSEELIWTDKNTVERGATRIEKLEDSSYRAEKSKGEETTGNKCILQ